MVRQVSGSHVLWPTISALPSLNVQQGHTAFCLILTWLEASCLIEGKYLQVKNYYSSEHRWPLLLISITPTECGLPVVALCVCMCVCTGTCVFLVEDGNWRDMVWVNLYFFSSSSFGESSRHRFKFCFWCGHHPLLLKSPLSSVCTRDTWKALAEVLFLIRSYSCICISHLITAGAIHLFILKFNLWCS